MSNDNALWRTPGWFTDLAADQLDLLSRYHSELLKFNLKLNLISRNTERDADEAHFADCVLAGRILAPLAPPGPIYDLGSGNGLPGLVLAIMMPDVAFVLVESDLRKVEFLKHVAHTLELSNVTCAGVRVETLPTGSVGTAVTRGFASVSKACMAMGKVMSPGAAVYHLKGSGWSTEIAEIPSQLMSQWTPELVGEYALPVTQARRAIVRTKRK